MNATKMSLDGKAVLVTGGSLGIGRAIALTFADAGADIAIAGRTLTNLQSVVNEIKSIGRRGLPVVSNIAEIQESKVLAERVLTEFGRIDILVNNAGANPWRGPLTKIEEWAWDAMFNLNLKGLFFLSQFVAGIMKKQGGGNIINIASVSGIKPRANSVYSVTKAGLIMLTKAMAKEWGQYNIRVNSIAPGLTKTRFNEGLLKDSAKAEALAKETALGRIGMPEDIARVALFLASDVSSHVTGDILVVDGGELLGPAPWPE